MIVPVLPEPDFKTPMPQKRQEPHANSLQEQFTGLVPVRNERPMAEILAERLAEANPASPSPLFIP